MSLLLGLKNSLDSVLKLKKRQATLTYCFLFNIRGCLPRNLYLSLLECSPCLAFSYHQLVNVKIAPPDPPTRPSPMEESLVNRSPTAPVPISPFCWSAVLAWPWPSFMSTLQKLRDIAIPYRTVPYFRICLTVAFCRISNFENHSLMKKLQYMT